MILQRFCCRIVLLICFWLVAVGPARAADLKGLVRDYAGPAGAGLGGVEISVYQGGLVIKKGVSDALGSYTLRNLPPQVPLVVQFVLAGYVQRPTKRNIRIDPHGENLDIDLLREAGSPEYYKEVADTFVARSRRKGSSFDSEWQELSGFGLPSGSAAMVVSALKNELGGDVFAHLEPDPVGHSGHEILSGPIIATKGVVSTVNAKDLTFTVKSKAGDESFKVTETAVVK